MLNFSQNVYIFLKSYYILCHMLKYTCHLFCGKCNKSGIGFNIYYRLLLLYNCLVVPNTTERQFIHNYEKFL